MTATEELRRMLDERGVEWRRTPHYSSESIDNETVFRGEGIEWYAHDHLNGRLGLRTARYEVTPEQAIEATLGRGTCRNISPKLGNDEFTCDECLARVYGSGGRWFDANWEYHKFNYCPNCGRKVVDA